MTTHPAVRPAAPAFRRDRFTWLAYFMLAFFAYFQAIIGPLMPFFRAELGLSYEQGGWHVTALALGMVVVGLWGVGIVAWLGRWKALWGGGAGMIAGGLLLAAGRQQAATLSGALLMGISGAFVVMLVQATLSDHHGPRRATALTESNVFASLSGILGSLLIGLFIGIDWGWRWALYVMMLAWVLAALTNARLALPAARPPEPSSTAGGSARRLPNRFWAYWGVMVLTVAAEWSVITWSADFLAGPVGLAKDLAATLMSVYFLAMTLGRFAGSRLTTRLDPARLLPAVLGLSLAGFLLLWQSAVPALNVAGLFVAGLGIANTFPLGLAVLTGIADRRSDAASARIALAAGIAILVTPLVLGRAADAVGMGQAFGLIAGLLGASLLAALVMLRWRAAPQ